MLAHEKGLCYIEIRKGKSELRLTQITANYFIKQLSLLRVMAAIFVFP